MRFARIGVVICMTVLVGLLSACVSDSESGDGSGGSGTVGVSGAAGGGTGAIAGIGGSSGSGGVGGVGGAGGGGAGGTSIDTDGGASDAEVVYTPPTPAGCITDVSPGDHTFTCGGLQVDMRLPPACEAPGCGLILQLHGDTGSGPLEDGHTNLRELGAMHGYIVVTPTGPPLTFGTGSTWSTADDAKLVDIVQQHAAVFRTDPKKVHVTGFSRGGFVTWRLLCDHADLFASAAPAGAGTGAAHGETACFSAGRAPSRKLPILFLLGRTDVNVGYTSMAQIRDAALMHYGTQAPDAPTVLAMDADYTHNQWTSPDGAIFESFDHGYETVTPGPWASSKGHCIPGSTVDPQGPQYALPCKPPNAFAWGEEVMAFFLAHPMP